MGEGPGGATAYRGPKRSRLSFTACVYTATVGDTGVGGAVPALVGITRRSGNPNGVFLQIRNSTSGANEDRDFFVLVFCGR